MREFFSFEIPVCLTTRKNGKVENRKQGDIIVSVDSDLDIISVLYGGVNIHALLIQLDAMEPIHKATENNYENRRTERAVEEENNLAENA